MVPGLLKPTSLFTKILDTPLLQPTLVNGSFHIKLRARCLDNFVFKINFSVLRNQVFKPS